MSDEPTQEVTLEFTSVTQLWDFMHTLSPIDVVLDPKAQTLRCSCTVLELERAIHIYGASRLRPSGKQRDFRSLSD